MEVAVLGGTGFIGSHYMEKYRDKHVLNLVPRHAELKMGRNDDFGYPNQLLYLISTTDNYNVFEAPQLDVQTNLVKLVEVLEYWKEYHSHATFNFISSWFVYGQKSVEENLKFTDHGSSETDLCNPKGFYSITKRCAEQLVQSYAETHGLKYRILRLANVVGHGDKGISKRKNALQYIIEELRVGKPVSLYDDGEFIRDYLHVDDCVRAINMVMNKGKPNNIYNIGSGYRYKFKDLVNCAHNFLDSTSAIRSMEPTEFHKQVQVQDFRMDIRKLRDLGFIPQYWGERELVKSLI